MRTLLLILVIVGYSAEAISSRRLLSDDGLECTCAAYILDDGGLISSNKIDSLDYHLPDMRCDGDGATYCKEHCAERFSKISAGGDLNVGLPDHPESTVGALACTLLNRDVRSRPVSVFARACGSDFMDTGLRSKQLLCCLNMEHVRC